MVTTVRDIVNILEEIAPENLAENWDNVGLLVGSPENEITNILLALDPLPALIQEAKSKRTNLIITHHPVIFKPLKALRTDTPIGRLVSEAIKANINLIGCHTNLDAAVGGVNDVLADGLGLDATMPLVTTGCDEGSSPHGLGRIGSYSSPLTPEAFIAHIRTACKPPWLLEAGPRPRLVKTVAVCGGSCSDYAQAALSQGADVFITAEIKHATARWAEDAGLWLIDGGHYATENLAMPALQKRLQKSLGQVDPGIAVHTASQEPPLKLITTIYH